MSTLTLISSFFFYNQVFFSDLGRWEDTLSGKGMVCKRSGTTDVIHAIRIFDVVAHQFQYILSLPWKK
nr:hypothetical protein [Bacteroides acidifaciens]